MRISTYYLPNLMTTLLVGFYLLDIIFIPFLYGETDVQKG